MRKTKFSAEVHQRIVKVIKDGATQRAAARRVGVTPETLTAWKKRFRAFGEDVERAHAEAQVRAETSLYRLAVRGNVRGLLAWLQSRHPEDWRQQQEVVVNAPADKTSMTPPLVEPPISMEERKRRIVEMLQMMKLRLDGKGDGNGNGASSVSGDALRARGQATSEQDGPLPKADAAQDIPGGEQQA